MHAWPWPYFHYRRIPHIVRRYPLTPSFASTYNVSHTSSPSRSHGDPYVLPCISSWAFAFSPLHHRYRTTRHGCTGGHSCKRSTRRTHEDRQPLTQSTCPRTPLSHLLRPRPPTFSTSTAASSDGESEHRLARDANGQQVVTPFAWGT